MNQWLRKSLVMLVTLGIFTFVGCGGNSTDKTTGNDEKQTNSEQNKVKAETEIVFWNESMQDIQTNGRDLETIKKDESIVIGMRKGTGVFFVDELSGNPTGFHYEIVKEFVNYLGVKKAIIKEIPSVAEFYKKDGVVSDAAKNDPNVTYQPDIFKNIDFGTGSITILPWREKLTSMYPLQENIELLFTSKDVKIESVNDLIGKKIVVGKDTSFVNLLNKINTDLGNKLNITVVPYTGEYGKTMAELIYSKQYDVSISDSSDVITLIDKYQGAIKPSIPIGSKKSYLGWTFNKNSKQLNDEFDVFIKKLKDEKKFDEMFKKFFKIDYQEYLQMLGK